MKCKVGGGTLTPERWAQIEELFHRAAECDPQNRAVLLDGVCADDSELRQRVEALLSSDQIAHGEMSELVHLELDALERSLIGKTVSHYRVLNVLGCGGMGQIHRAKDIKLDRQVAIKFLPEDSAKEISALRRFEREARSVSALEHPNICPIYEFGEHEGQPFMVMPLLEGQTLEEFIRKCGSPKQRKEFQKLVDVAIQTLRGLESANDRGIIHRDIKPSNIFLTTHGQAKILDFGIAKLTRAEVEDLQDSHSLALTETTMTINADDVALSGTGAVIGTAAYMSPEQVRGEKVDARTDIFSFGLVLYEMATGKRAFAGNSWPVLKEAVLSGTPKGARELNLAIPIKLESVINKAIEKDRAARFQSAAEMRADLEILQRELAPRNLPRTWAIGLAVFALALIGTVFFALNRPAKTISVAPDIKLRQLTTNSGENPVNNGAISPDGKYLAYSDTRGLHLKLIATEETEVVPLPDELNHKGMKWEVGPWFPDSTRFLVNVHPSVEAWNEWSSASTNIWTVSALGGMPTKLRNHAIAWSISPDGSTVSFGTNKGKLGEREIWLMDLNGKQTQKFQEVSDDNAICCFGWAPDGKSYGYVLTDASGDTLLTRDVRGGAPHPLLQSSELRKSNDIVWLHNGRVIYSVRELGNSNVCNYWTMRLDLSTGKRVEQPRRLTNWPSFCVSSGVATTDDKKLTFAAWSNFSTSYVADLEGGGSRLGNIRHFTLEDSDDAIMDWTADSKSVIVAHNLRDHYGFYKQALDSDRQEPLVSSAGGGVVALAGATPDNKWIIALIWPAVEGRVEERPSVPLPLVRIPLTGGTPETILELSRPAFISCTRPPLNRCVIAESSEDHRQMIVSALDAIKGRGAELARFNLARDVDVLVENLICAISPDGNRLAFARSPESPIEIYTLSDQKIRKVTSQSFGQLAGLVWAPDQSGFFITRKAEDGTEMLHLDFQWHLGSLRKCFGWGCFPVPSPDGRHLAIIDNTESTNMWMMENF